MPGSLVAQGITKRYPGVVALGGVDFEAPLGQVTGLVGENGAGKSTLIRILGGLAAPDAGTVEFEGVPWRPTGAAEALRAGIGVIHQELNDVGNLDVAGNVLLGREPRRFGLFVDRQETARRASAALRRLGLDLAPDTPQSQLSIAQRQMVEIAKALALDAKLLIMDEPTSSLAAEETERLASVIRDLREQGVGVVYVSHRLKEVVALADRVWVLRDGQNAGVLEGDAITPDNMVRHMVGRDVTRLPARPEIDRPVALEVRGLRTRRFPTRPLDFEVREGEIVVLAGLVGAGRSEALRAIFGVDPRAGGEVHLAGKTVPGDVRGAIAAGLALVPEDRRREGLVTAMSVRENVSLPSLRRFARAGLVNRRQERAVAERMREELRIKTPNVESAVRNLSGGNQQKVVLAKWLLRDPRVLLFDEPTRGIDVGARQEIYLQIRALADRGVAVLIVSSDMEEVLAIADRVLVMREGTLQGEFSRAEATEEAILAQAVAHA